MTVRRATSPAVAAEQLADTADPERERATGGHRELLPETIDAVAGLAWWPPPSSAHPVQPSDAGRAFDTIPGGE